jgi:hypothetical protein
VGLEPLQKRLKGEALPFPPQEDTEKDTVYEAEASLHQTLDLLALQLGIHGHKK